MSSLAETDRKYRIEQAIKRMFKIAQMRKDISALQDEIDGLLLVSEIRNPESVKGVNLDVLRLLEIVVDPAVYVGHQAHFRDINVNLHTERREPPSDTIFQHALRELGYGQGRK